MCGTDGRVHSRIRLYRRCLLGGAAWAAAGPDEPPPGALRDRVGATLEGVVSWVNETSKRLRETIMQIGFNAPTSGPLIGPDSLTRIITEGEALGFDYVTISDHIMVPRNLESKYPYTDTGEFPAGTQAAWLEQLATTAYIAALTKKLRFVLSVMVVPHRPAV